MTLSPSAIDWFRSLAVAGLVLAGAGVAAEIVARRRHRGRARTRPVRVLDVRVQPPPGARRNGTRDRPASTLVDREILWPDL